MSIRTSGIISLKVLFLLAVLVSAYSAVRAHVRQQRTSTITDCGKDTSPETLRRAWSMYSNEYDDVMVYPPERSSPRP